MAERGDPSESDDLPTWRGSSDGPESGEPTLGQEPSFPRRGSVSGEFQSVHTFVPGARVGRFVLERKLGEGGMGLVFLARDPELERAVAVKVLRLDRGVGDANAHQRMLREARAMAMLSHPNLVTIYEVGTLAGNVFLAMEYVTGQSLHEWLEGPRSVEDILVVFDQAGRGLGAMHDAGLVHRDFKPANVVVTDEGLVKVLDLGIARRVSHGARAEALPEGLRTSGTRTREVLLGQSLDDPLTRDGAIVGTPPYMPLEQILGEATSPASDQFAFAVALFEALAGEKPFPGHERLELLKHVLAEERRAWPAESSAPPALRAAIDRALSLYPEQRFESMSAFLDACWTALGQSAHGAASARWQAGGRLSDPLLPSAPLEATEPAQEAPPTFDDVTTRTNERAIWLRWVPAALLVLVLIALVAALRELDRRSQALEAAERAELESTLAHVSGRVEAVFARAEQNLWFAYDQQHAWLPLLERLEASQHPDLVRAERELRVTVAQLNDLFRPVVERSPRLRWLGVARADGLALFLLTSDRNGASSLRLENRVIGPDLERPVLELSWSADAAAPPRAKWSRAARALGRDPGFSGHVPTLGAWFGQAPQNTPRVAWSLPYRTAGSAETGALASIVWNRGSQRYVLAIALALTDISEITTELREPRLVAFVTTRDHRVLGLPKDDRPPQILSPVGDLHDGTLRAALAVEPQGHRMLWPFWRGERTRWAGRAFLDPRYPELTIYAIQTGTD